ncbi:MAG: hypothetical protein K2X76_07670 [Sphingomonas sp.]|nr:hypothetical protein [Sphingomonas sp.]
MRKSIGAGALALAMLLSPTAASAQAGAVLQCAGKRVTIRYSEIKPGQLETFKMAIAAHNAWYAAGKNATRTTLIRLVKGSGNNLAYDSDAAMTMTVYDSKPQPARDAGYAAFVKLYTDSSTLKDEHRGCMGE